MNVVDGSTGSAAPMAKGAPTPALPPWGWRECALGVAAAIVSLILLFTVVAIVIGTGGAGNEQSVRALAIGLVATIVLEASLFGIALTLTAGRFPGGLQLLGWRPRPISQWIGWSVLAVLLAWTTLLGYVGILKAAKLESWLPKSNVPQGLFDHRPTVALAIFLTVVAAPVVEETFFRGFLFSGMRRSLGFSLAATVSGLLFALAHFSPTLIVPFTIIGVIFAFTYWRTGTLLASITAHMTFNLVSVLGALAIIGRH